MPLQNDDNESFGPITLTEALAHSVNTVWAQVAEKLGKPTMGRYMHRFGFNRKPELDYPAEEMSAAASTAQADGCIGPPSPRVDVGRMGIGQDKLEVTPLQMAEVAAAVANHGRLMVPHMTGRIVDPEGRTVQRIEPRVQSVVMKPSTAELGHDDDGSGRQRRHGSPPRSPASRWPEDRHRGDADRDRDQQRLVHRVRARARTARCDRRDARRTYPAKAPPSRRRSQEKSWKGCCND